NAGRRPSLKRPRWARGLHHSRRWTVDLLDRLRPRWRRSDPEERVAAVREMGADDQSRLIALAQSDPDARVRRVAIKKLDDADALDGVARDEADEDLRALA